MDRKDFFISYNKADKQWAKWIAGTLEEKGYTTIIQAWDFRPGNNFVLEMQNALAKCDRTIVVLSEEYLKSEYCQTEWTSVFCCDPIGTNRELIPVRVSDVSPKGLLSQVIYIDLFCEEELAAAKKLLNGVDKGVIPRKKAPFPTEKRPKDSSVDSDGNSTYEFVFELNKENQAKPLCVKTRNALRSWFVGGRPIEFLVTINDERVETFKNQISGLVLKIQNEQELSKAEEHEYFDLDNMIKKCEHETAIKARACTFFLQDGSFHAYSMLTRSSYLDLYTFVETILSFNYYNEVQKRLNDSRYTTLDLTINPPPQECHNYFIAPLESEKIAKVYGGTTLYHISGDVSYMGRELLMEVAVFYYLFLAEEILSFNKIHLCENKKVLNLLNYAVGLH